MILRLPTLFLALSLAAATRAAELTQTTFASSDRTPSPACLAVAASGEVYVGVDLLGSLGKGPGKGRIVRLVDENNDGVADRHTTFAEVDNPRGLLSFGDQLYVLHTIIPKDTGVLAGMNLSVFADKNADGIADGPPRTLIRDISVPKHNQDRGADHTTNGIRMGIDGWIYIAVGDFGFVNATGTDGTTLSMLGGGIVRVRPDGSEMETYTHGMRNIYDVAIDPFLNIFTRGNTNDGGGWNVRFTHHIQSGQYGYPMLFKNFTHEIIPALADHGGGSGTGAVFLDEPGWPASVNQMPLMADWGRNQVFLHRITPDGPSFTEKAEDFLGISQPVDVDVDGSGRLYIAAWAGAGYKGNPERGFVQRAVPTGWTYKPFPKLTQLAPQSLVKGLSTRSATTRLATQQEILRRADASLAPSILAIAQDKSQHSAGRVAALFTYAQLLNEASHPALLELAKDPSLTEFALRAAADRRKQAAKLPLEPFQTALSDRNPRVQAAAAIALGRIGRREAAQALLTVARPPAVPKIAPAPKPAPPLFDSGVIKGTESREVEISLLGVNNLYLVVEDAGDGDGGDHAGWFDPILTRRDGETVPLTRLKWKSANQGWGRTTVNGSPDGSPLRRADGKPHSQGIGTHAASVIHYVIPGAMEKLKLTVALCSSRNESASVTFKILSQAPPTNTPGQEGPHATPNPAVIIPHLAIRSLVDLRAIEECLAALDGPSRDGALRTLQAIHEPSVVQALLQKHTETTDAALRDAILTILARLHTREAPYDGSWWWGTQPDTRGPYYVPVTWGESAAIEQRFREVWANSSPEQQGFLTALANRHRMNLQGIGEVENTTAKKEKTVGQYAIEDIIVALQNQPGDPTRGREVMKTQACAACHSIAEGDPKRGPDLNHVGNTLSREAIAEAILRPDASISTSWVDVSTKAGTTVQGTLVEKSASRIVIRDIAGNPTTLNPDEVKEIKTASSTLMGPHLMDNLTLAQFTDVIAYLHSLK